MIDGMRLAELLMIAAHMEQEGDEMGELKYDQLYVFELVRQAYERGYNWGQQNPNSRPFLNKAAYDYADKTVGPRDEDKSDERK